MIKQYKKNELGHVDHGWLDTFHHFSFASYYNPDRMGFGALRVINDDTVKVQTGFGTHPHSDMEIISYVIDGKLTHKDSMGNEETIERGHFQYMSAGTGITHSEYNMQIKEKLRFLQIWIIPDENNLTPNYGDFRPDWNKRINYWYNIVSGKSGDGEVKIYQDMNIFVSDINKEITFDVKKGRQVYIVNIEGNTNINGLNVESGDGLEVIEETITFKPKDKSHIIILEMKKA